MDRVLHQDRRIFSLRTCHGQISWFSWVRNWHWVFWIMAKSYTLAGCDDRPCSQYWFKMELPIFMLLTQSLFHISSFVDLTRVMEGPRARWAPEQFIHTKTPKSSEAPDLKRTITAGWLAVAVWAELIFGAFQQGGNDFLLCLVCQH